ncbi:MAG: hypothetical protein WCX69_05680, partial [Candidatus Paceibacterota bacterium]
LPKNQKPYQNEVGQTPEDWITMFLQHLEETGQVIDDFQGNGSVNYLLAAFHPSAGFVPSGRWSRGNRQAYLGRRDPRSRAGDCGARSAVVRKEAIGI